MTQYIGQITVIVDSDSTLQASDTLCSLAKQLDDSCPDVVFADHNGDVEDYEKIERECEESHTPMPSLPARFDAYEIHGVREFDEGNGKFCEQVPDGDAEFWSLYGHVPGAGVICIGDFATRQFAEEVYARITGDTYGR